MMMNKFLASSILLLAAPVSAQTTAEPNAAAPNAVQSAVAVPQTTVNAPQNTLVVPQQAAGDVLRAGAPIPVVLSEYLTTKGKKLNVGQRVRLEVAQDIMVNGRLVIPARSPVEGVLTEVRNKGMWGKSGYIGARVLSLRLGDRQIRLNGTFTDKGVTGTAGVVA